MKVKELIDILKYLPENADVYHIWDGEPRSKINHVYLANNGDVMTIDSGSVVYSDNARPKGAPSSSEVVFWKTPEAGLHSSILLGDFSKLDIDPSAGVDARACYAVGKNCPSGGALPRPGECDFCVYYRSR